uniref:Uncharacterized protein n=1 Tax=Ovis aries TaxID=9940 RepID=A0AC11D8W8_SHEEP
EELGVPPTPAPSRAPRWTLSVGAQVAREGPERRSRLSCAAQTREAEGALPWDSVARAVLRGVLAPPRRVVSRSWLVGTNCRSSLLIWVLLRFGDSSRQRRATHLSSRKSWGLRSPEPAGILPLSQTRTALGWRASFLAAGLERRVQTWLLAVPRLLRECGPPEGLRPPRRCLIIAFDELRTDFKSPIDQCNPLHARERLRNIERICFLLRKLVLPEYSIHSLFCIMFLCAQEWLTLGLNVPLLFYHFWRYFHCPADSSELAYDPPVVMNADTLSYCQKEAWCKLAFYLLSFFYYLYCMIYTLVSS